jgi:hypothetical protein
VRASIGQQQQQPCWVVERRVSERALVHAGRWGRCWVGCRASRGRGGSRWAACRATSSPGTRQARPKVRHSLRSTLTESSLPSGQEVARPC